MSPLERAERLLFLLVTAENYSRPNVYWNGGGYDHESVKVSAEDVEYIQSLGDKFNMCSGYCETVLGDGDVMLVVTKTVVPLGQTEPVERTRRYCEPCALERGYGK